MYVCISSISCSSIAACMPDRARLIANTKVSHNEHGITVIRVVTLEHKLATDQVLLQVLLLGHEKLVEK